MARSDGRGEETLTALEKLHGPIPQLLVGDIVCIRHKKSFFRFFLRKVTSSYWDHTIMVLYPSGENGRSSVIVESIRNGLVSFVFARGVAVHKIEKYLNDPEKYDVGIKRVPALTQEERERVRLFMLMNVDAPYWPWRPVAVMLASFTRSWTEDILRKQRFSCSSLIQQAYYGALPWDRKNKVLFKEGVWSPIELQEYTNPGDIAASANTEWVYNPH